jgi:glutathione S-transferase
VSWQIVPRALGSLSHEPAALRPSLLVLHHEGTDRTLRKPDAIRVQNARPDHPENGAELAGRWPVAKFHIIEHLAASRTGPVPLIPSGTKAAVPVRMLDRVFDNYVMGPMQAIVGDALRPEGARDPHNDAQARTTLDTIHAWLDRTLARHQWAAGDAFTLPDAAAAPALFYADWTHPIGQDLTTLKAYRARLLGRPSFARCIDDEELHFVTTGIGSVGRQPVFPNVCLRITRLTPL